MLTMVVGHVAWYRMMLDGGCALLCMHLADSWKLSGKRISAGCAHGPIGPQS